MFDTADLAPIASALAWSVLPGALIATSARMAGAWWLAALLPASLFAVGGSGIAAALIGAPFGWGAPLLLALAAVVLIESVRFAVHRHGWSMRPLLGTWSAPVLAVAAAVLVSGAVLAVQVGSAVDLSRDLSQTYDGVFHLNAVAFVLDSGDASSFHLYRMTHPGEDNEFYPAAWHALAALVVQTTGCSIPAAANAVWLATMATGWSTGVALLCGVVVPRASRTAATVIGAALATASGAFPLVLLSWGTLYPTGLAYAIMPTGLAVAAALLLPDKPLGRSRRITLWAAAGVWLVAASLAHPRSLLSFAVVAAPLGVWWAVAAGRAQLAKPGGRRRVVIACSAVGVALLGVAAVGALYVWRTFDVGGRPISDRLNGGPARATQTIPEAFAQILVLSARDPLAVMPAIALAVVVVLGAAVAIRSRRLSWLPFSWLAVATLFALASGTDADFAKLATGLWYKDQFRLLALAPLTAVPLAAIGILRFGELVARRPPFRAGAAAALTVLVAVTAWTGPATARELDAVRDTLAIAPSGTSGVLIDDDEYALLSRLDELVPEGELIVGSPWSGATLSWALGGRKPLFPHFVGEWTADELLVAERLDTALDDPEVCMAVHRLGVEYLLHDPVLMWGEPVEAHAFRGIAGAASVDGLLTEVARSGDTVLFRIAGCGPSGQDD